MIVRASESTHNSVPRWALVAAPLIATAVANADIAILLFADPESWSGRLRLGLAATMPLSILSGFWTLALLLRTRREMLRREAAESDMRRALADSERSLNHESALRRELDHRVRNNLAGLAGLISLYEKSGRPAAQISHALRGKIRAMKEVHDIINRTGGAPVDLLNLVMRVCDAIVTGPRRQSIEVRGPSVPLTTGEASAFAMIVQEMLTNSMKHGALGMPEGTVSVSWEASPGAEGVALEMSWSESPLVSCPKDDCDEAGSGVGLPLIEGFARSDLRGDVMFERSESTWSARLKGALVTPAQFLAVHAPRKEILV